MLIKHGRAPLYAQLKDDLLVKIKQGVWLTDSQIPTEKVLMAEYRVGRATVRESISILVDEGYLTKKHGIGTFVSKNPSSFGFEPLISLTYSLKAKGIHTENVLVEKQKIVPDKKLSDKMKSKAINECLYIRRLRFADGSAIGIEDSYFSDAFMDIGERFDLTDSFAKIILRDLNLSIKRVEQVVVPRVSTEAEQKILLLDANARVLDLERWIYLPEQSYPFYYLHFVIPENIYSLSAF